MTTVPSRLRIGEDEVLAVDSEARLAIRGLDVHPHRFRQAGHDRLQPLHVAPAAQPFPGAWRISPTGKSSWKTRSRCSTVNLGSITRTEEKMAAELLRAPEAARRLDIPTKELLRLIYERKIRYVMVKGIAHVPDDAISEYQAQSS